jgi:hypothetical protein
MINTFTNGFGLIVLMYLLAFIFGLVYRAILKNLAKKKMLSGEGRGSKNIGKGDRLLRLVIGVGLLVWAIMTTWSPILLFFSGFAFLKHYSPGAASTPL